MQAEELFRLLRKRPFKPLRIITTEGTVFEVRDSDQIFISASFIEIGVDRNPKTGVWRTAEHLSPLYVARVEDLESATPVAAE
jgi:hypothetical protein